MIAFYLFAAVLIFLSYKSFRGGINYLRYFRQEISKPESDFTPFASIIAPCRGLDEGLRENLSALFRQNYPNYEVIFVVDDESDEAYEIIQELLRRNANAAKLCVAGRSESESQKVHNLREAVLRVDEKSKVFVFVDSDARPNADWLRNLIAPLRDEKIGATTGYRWFVSKKGNLASELLSVWNASIASALGANLKSNFCWGGSTAIRSETFENLRVRDKWRGTLSDDFVVTRTMKAAGMPIYFVPQCLTISLEDCSFRELLEFTTRQMKITRVYAPHLWKASFIGSFLFNAVFVWGIAIVVYRLLYGDSVLFPLLALLSVSAFSIGKSWLRLKAVKLVLKDFEKELRKQFLTHNTLWIFSPALFLYNSFRALVSRKIVWRGIKYKLQSPNETVILSEQLPESGENRQ